MAAWPRLLLPRRVRAVTDGFFQRFMLGLRSLSSPSDMTAIFLTSVLIWLLETVKYWFVMHAFDFSVGFIVLMLMNGLVNLATTLPAAPGYIGTFDTPGIMTLQAFGVDPSVAASYTFTLHAALWVPVTLLGGYFFWRNHLHMSDIATAGSRRSRRQPKAVQRPKPLAAPDMGNYSRAYLASDVRGRLPRQRKSVQFERLLSGRYLRFITYSSDAVNKCQQRCVDIRSAGRRTTDNLPEQRSVLPK